MSRAPDELARVCRQAQLIGGMLVLTVPVFAFVVEMLRTNQAPFLGFSPKAPLGLLRFVFATMAVLILVIVNLSVSRSWPARRPAGRPSRSGSSRPASWRWRC